MGPWHLHLFFFFSVVLLVNLSFCWIDATFCLSMNARAHIEVQAIFSALGHRIFYSKANKTLFRSLPSPWSPFMTNDTHTHTRIQFISKITSHIANYMTKHYIFVFSHLFYKCKRSVNVILTHRTDYMLVSLCHNDKSSSSTTTLRWKHSI